MGLRPLAHHPSLETSEHPMRLQHFQIHALTRRAMRQSLSPKLILEVMLTSLFGSNAQVLSSNKLSKCLLMLCLTCWIHYWTSYVGQLPTHHPSYLYLQICLLLWMTQPLLPLWCFSRVSCWRWCCLSISCTAEPVQIWYYFYLKPLQPFLSRGRPLSWEF